MTLPPSVCITDFVHASAAETEKNQLFEVRLENPNTVEFQAARRGRYALQSLAQALLHETRLRHPRSDRWRTVGCLRAATEAVRVMYQPALGRASYAGACVCGAPWVCAVCSARITELRRAEIAAAHAVHGAAGGSAAMLTLTVPHAAADSLADVLGTRRGGQRTGLRGAVQRLRNSRAWQSATRQLGMLGAIQATEITFGASGWHPHQHQLLLLGCPQDDRLRLAAHTQLSLEWQRAAIASGLGEPSLERGVDLRWAWDASSYLAKLGHERTTWGADAELARAATKRGRKGSRGPWELLRDAGDGDELALRLWAELITTTVGLPQLRWSRGLRAALALGDERSDEELAREVDAESIQIAIVSRSTWRRVLSLDYRARIALLEAAEADPAHGVATFLASLQAAHAAGLAAHKE